MSTAEIGRLEIAGDGDRGRGDYPAYHALWHLAEIGVVTDLHGFASEAWDLAAARLADGANPTRIALIDTSVAEEHPNLKEAMNTDLAIDFFSSRLGVAANPGALSKAIRGAEVTLPEGLSPEVAKLLEELRRHLGDGVAQTHASPVRPATSPSFSAHGTAMAGLIGARPLDGDAVPLAAFTLFDTASGSSVQVPSGNGAAFAYAGVDPFCEIVPISTNFDPEPEQLILAMLFAASVSADIIVLARDFPAPASLAPGVDPTAEALGRALGVGLSPEELAAWDSLHALAIALSRRIPIVCAAGNGAQDSILSPGALAAADNGIIAVGARAATGRAAAYSPVSDAVTVYAPSGDGERLDRDLQRLDTQNGRFNPNDHSAAYRAGLGTLGDESPVSAGTFAPQDLVSTDVPGRAGYNSSPNAQVFGRDGAVLDYRSAYCRFSGTSGAAALTGGLLSLAISAGRLTAGGAQFGIDAKAALCRGIPHSHARAEPAISWAAFGESSRVPS